MTKPRGMEIRVGIVILIGILVGATGLFLVSGGLDALRRFTTYTILFRDAGGISKGDDVLLAGQKVGTVTGIADRLDVDEEGQERYYVAVAVKIYEDKVVPEDSEVTVSTSVTNIVKLNIKRGTGRRASGATKLYGRKLATFEEVVDAGKQSLTGVNKAISTAQGALEKIDAIVDDFRKQDLAQQAGDFMAKANDAAQEAKGMIAEARQPVRNILGDLERAADRIERFVGQAATDWDTIAADAKTTVSNAKSVTGKADAILDENRNDFRAIVQNIKDASLRAAPVLEQVERLLRSAGEVVEEVRPRLVAAMESARRALVTFEDVTEDLKTAPWKALRKPSTTEIREVHLYNTLRLWTEGIRDVQELVRQLDAMRTSGALADPAQVERVAETLEAFQRAVQQYDRAWQQVQREILTVGEEK
ncbi:MAG: MlaD family protein [Planctomycetota bacterium]